MAKRIFHYDPNEAGDLHCDACGHDLPDKVAFTQSLIGTPCPKCGANMLTVSDYMKTASLLRKIDLINKWLGPLFGRDIHSPGGAVMQVKCHDDEITIKKLCDL